MEAGKCRDAAGVAEFRSVPPGRTAIGEIATPDLIAYVVRALGAVYVDPANLARAAAALGASVRGTTMTIARPGARGFTLACAIHPLAELPQDKPAEIGDAKVVAGHVCTLVEPGFCCTMLKEDGSFDFSFRAPSYGMSWCKVEAAETCAAWLHEETCETFPWPLCQPLPGVIRPITAWVCSIE